MITRNRLIDETAADRQFDGQARPTSATQVRRGERKALARILATVAAVAAFCASLGFATAASASTTVYGQVACMDDSAVEGVWVAASSGSGWANWSPVGGYGSHYANFSRGGVGGSWTVHVGCGGSTSNWRYSVNGNTTVTWSNQSWSCYPPDMGYPYSFCQRS